MRRSLRCISAIAISAYLAATLVPCEVAPGLRIPWSSGHAEATPEPAPTQDEAAAPRASHSHETHDHSSHSHAASGHSATSHAPDPTRVDPPHTVSSHSDSSHSGRGTTEATPARVVEARFFKAQCLCGCGETRGSVGGGAARLGVAVPIAELTQLLTFALPRIADESSDRLASIVLEIDPVPI